MVDTIFAVTGKTLFRGDRKFAINAAGIRNDEPYAEVSPHDDTVVQTILEHIRKAMPLAFSLEEVQRDLAR